MLLNKIKLSLKRDHFLFVQTEVSKEDVCLEGQSCFFVFNMWIVNNTDEQMSTTAEPSLYARQRPAHLDILTHLILRTAWWKWGCNIILTDWHKEGQSLAPVNTVIKWWSRIRTLASWL